MSKKLSVMNPTDAEYLRQLWLMQLADSALPIGATAHSLGLELWLEEHLKSPSTERRLIIDAHAPRPHDHRHTHHHQHD